MKRALAVALALGAMGARADDLPVSLQVHLLATTSTYIGEFGPAGGGPVKVLVVFPGTTETRGAQALGSAITQVGTFGRFKAEPKLLGFTDPKKFDAALAAEKAQVVFLAPELDAKAVAAVVAAAESAGCVTVSGVPSHVKQGAVLGFSLIEGRPRVLVNLKQAQKQNIVFLAGLVSHSVVVER